MHQSAFISIKPTRTALSIGGNNVKEVRGHVADGVKDVRRPNCLGSSRSVPCELTNPELAPRRRILLTLPFQSSTVVERMKRKRHAQLDLGFPARRGGKRDGAGRKA